MPIARDKFHFIIALATSLMQLLSTYSAIFCIFKILVLKYLQSEYFIRSASIWYIASANTSASTARSICLSNNSYVYDEIWIMMWVNDDCTTIYSHTCWLVSSSRISSTRSVLNGRISGAWTWKFYQNIKMNIMHLLTKLKLLITLNLM